MTEKKTHKKDSNAKKVSEWLLIHGVPTDNSELIKVFPEITVDNLNKIKSRFKQKLNVRPKRSYVKKEKKKDENDEENNENSSHNSNDILDSDLRKDIKKIKTVMSIFGENVRLGEVVSFLKEMDALRPTKEDMIQKSLKGMDIDQLTNIITGKKYQSIITEKSALDENIIKSFVGDNI